MVEIQRFRVYDKRLRDIEFSFSPILDKKKNSKLVQTRNIFMPKPVKTSNGELILGPKSEVVATMTEIRVGYSKELLALFHQFDIDSKKLN